MADKPSSALGRLAASSIGSTIPLSSDLTTNIFWIAATLTFDLQTGATNQILTFSHREQDASVFSKLDAEAYKEFVRVRAEHFSKGIRWYVEDSKLRPQRFVIRGEQDAV